MMEIITLLRANIRHKKGSFIGIILLMIIVTMSTASIISARDDIMAASRKEMERIDAGNVLAFIKSDLFTEEMRQKVENYRYTEKVVVRPAIMTDGVTCGNLKYTNMMVLERFSPEYRVFNEDIDKYLEKSPMLQKGEIYLTLGFQDKVNCRIGDTITVSGFKDKQFTVKGFVAEPCVGSSVMGFKQFFISDEDYDAMYDEMGDQGRDYKYYALSIYKTEDCNLPDGQFRRQLNLSTGLLDKTASSITYNQSAEYTNLLPNMVLGVMMVFSMMLFAIVIIVMGHSITTGIEMEYVEFGVLKAQGFSKGKIKLIIALQYILAQSVGIAIGIVLAAPMTKMVCGIFTQMTAILSAGKIAWIKVVAIVVALLGISVIFTLLFMRKVGKISPVRAISGGRDEIYFGSRLNAPIAQKLLISTLAFRQITASKRQYIGAIAIVVILTFFMMTTMLSFNAIGSEDAMESMGLIICDCEISVQEKISDDKLSEIEAAVSKITELKEKQYITTGYLSVEGEPIYGIMYKYPENIKGMLEGRAPLYDNEIVITDIVAEALNVDIGDSLSVSKGDVAIEYLIVGKNQSMNDVGMNVTMGMEGTERIRPISGYYGGYRLADPNKTQQVVDMLNEEYGDIITAEKFEMDSIVGVFRTAGAAVTSVVYTISALVAAIVVSMVCRKAFLKERKDIGIYKSMGFTSRKLRLQFAIRYLIAAIIGSALGYGLCLAASQPILNTLMKFIGVTNYAVIYTPETIIIPVAIICFFFFIFAYVSSRRVKRVKITDLISD